MTNSIKHLSQDLILRPSFMCGEPQGPRVAELLHKSCLPGMLFSLPSVLLIHLASKTASFRLQKCGLTMRFVTHDWDLPPFQPLSRAGKATQSASPFCLVLCPASCKNTNLLYRCERGVRTCIGHCQLHLWCCETAPRKLSNLGESRSSSMAFGLFEWRRPGCTYAPRVF